MSKHTPGPWTFDAVDGPFEVIGSDRHRLAMVRMAYRSSDEAQGNARLIASAPYMLEVLKAIEARSMGATFNRTYDILKLARGAIRKAEGRESER